jgi:hypothetical protein
MEERQRKMKKAIILIVIMCVSVIAYKSYIGHREHASLKGKGVWLCVSGDDDYIYGAEVYIDHRLVGKTEKTFAGCPLSIFLYYGKHTIEIMKSGYITCLDELDIETGTGPNYYYSYWMRKATIGITSESERISCELPPIEQGTDSGNSGYKGCKDLKVYQNGDN